jgi:hypothetical protein
LFTPLQGEQVLLVGLERFENALELEFLTLGPEFPRDRPVRREEENEALLLRAFRCETGQSGEKGQGGGGDSEVTEEVAAGRTHGERE